MSSTHFSTEERDCFYNAIQELDPESVYVSIDKNEDTLNYTDLIMSEERISGRPSDEELTRCLIILNLIFKYGYKSENLEIENSFAIGGRRRERARAIETDIIIKNDNGVIEKIFEVKRIHEFNGVDDSSIKTQLFDPHNNIVKYNSARYLFYVSLDIPLERTQFPLICIGIDTSIANTYDEWSQNGKTPHFVDIISSGQIPVVNDVYVKLSGNEQNLQQQFRDLSDNYSIEVLKRIWRTLWDAIWGGTLEDNKKFENFNKVLLAKIYDERKTKIGTSYQFQRKFSSGVPQSLETLANNIDLLYRRAFREYLSKDREIELKDIKGIDFKEFSPTLIAKCVESLCSIAFHRNRYRNIDILGEFYEMVIRESFKQTKGLFLTHPNIVLFILAVLDVESLVTRKLRNPDEDNRFRLPFVIDPSCGTGTFLVNYMKYVQKFVDENKTSICSGDEDARDFIERQMSNSNAYKWVIDYVYGIDNEQVLAAACQINMILHGDGSTNIYNTDGLDSFSNYASLSVTGANNMLSSREIPPSSYYSKNSIEKFDFVISNPPFNVKIDRLNIQDNFEISGESQAYFLERWYQLLKPNGRLGVVLPESFFSVEDDIKGRVFLYKHFNIKSIVSLPNFAFSPHTTTSTSLLFATKKTRLEEDMYTREWHQSETIFNEKYSRFNSLVSIPKRQISFDKADSTATNGIKNYLQRIEVFLTEEFGKTFLILPYFPDEYLFDDDKFNQVKAKIKSTVLGIRNRWIIHNVTYNFDSQFYNFSISNLGYKAGKKGSKDKPNELFSVYDESDRKIYNIKYSHTWNRIDFQDESTVLGIIRGLNIWE
jgi:type I restriction enzyme M protein